MITKVISGGQTGIDEMGLSVAYELGITTGGTAPKGWRTEKGQNLELRDKYSLKESRSSSYEPRTEDNVEDSDGTVLFGDMGSPGSKLTIHLLKKYKKPYIENPTAEQLDQFIKDNYIYVLNVAGNRGSKTPTHLLLKYADILLKALKNNIL